MTTTCEQRVRVSRWERDNHGNLSLHGDHPILTYAEMLLSQLRFHWLLAGSELDISVMRAERTVETWAIIAGTGEREAVTETPTLVESMHAVTMLRDSADLVDHTAESIMNRAADLIETMSGITETDDVQ